MLKRFAFICILAVLAWGLAMPAHAARHKNAPVAPTPVAETHGAVHEGEAASTEASHEEGSGGLPQMDISRFPGQLFWLAITFMLTYVLMRQIALPAVQSTLDMREKRISADIGASRAKNEEAKHLMNEYQARLTKARADAQNATRVVTEESSKKAADAMAIQSAKVNDQIKAADARILDQKKTAMAALDKEVVSVVSELVKSVAGLTPSAADVEAAVQKVRKA